MGADDLGAAWQREWARAAAQSRGRASDTVHPGKMTVPTRHDNGSEGGHAAMLARKALPAMTPAEAARFGASVDADAEAETVQRVFEEHGAVLAAFYEQLAGKMEVLTRHNGNGNACQQPDAETRAARACARPTAAAGCRR